MRTDIGGILVRFRFRETKGGFRGAEDLEGFEESREGDLEAWRLERIVRISEGCEESFI